jgi:5-(carboxyamino)imidazole ribonucleotide synthase
VERALELECEVSVLVARTPGGEVALYPPAYNHHVRQILDWSAMPAPIGPKLYQRAQELAGAIAEAVKLEGLLVVEMFVTQDGEVLVNELAPRPHNSYHGSERACVTGQFEQLVRAVCDLRLGSTEIVAPTAITNLLGELWENGTPDFAAALSDSKVRIHLYEKSGARPGRKMGHLSAIGTTQEEALASVRRARHLLLNPEQRMQPQGVTKAEDPLARNGNESYHSTR